MYLCDGAILGRSSSFAASKSTCANPDGTGSLNAPVYVGFLDDVNRHRRRIKRYLRIAEGDEYAWEIGETD